MPTHDKPSEYAGTRIAYERNGSGYRAVLVADWYDRWRPYDWREDFIDAATEYKSAQQSLGLPDDDEVLIGSEIASNAVVAVHVTEVVPLAEALREMARRVTQAMRAVHDGPVSEDRESSNATSAEKSQSSSRVAPPDDMVL